MIRSIGARWKYGNIWSRSVLIGPSPFYVLDLASNRCLNTVTSLIIYLHLMDINSNNNETLLLPFGAHSAGEIPVPIPNTEVKPSSADYTAKVGN